MQTSFEGFVYSLRSEDKPVALSPARFAMALDLPLQKMASLARVHRNTVTNAPDSPKLQEAMSAMLRVLSAASSLCGDVEKALFWFRNQPIPDFGHRTAMEVIQQGSDRVDALIDYIESISGGASG